MVALAVASMAGTALPYERSLNAVYCSWWFRLILLLLAGNLVLCTYQRLAGKVLPSLRPRFFKAPAFYENGPMRFSFESSRPIEQVEEILSAHGFRVAREGEFLCARKGIFALFASPLAHLGFILVLIGGFASGLVAFHARLRLNEGETKTDMILEGSAQSERPMGFAVRCADFKTGTFPRTQIPSHFVTTLEITDNGKKTVGTVEVNKALKYGGLKFHQASFGEVPGQFRYRVAVRDVKSSRTIETVADVGQRRPIEGWDRDLLLTASIAGTRYSVLNGEKVEGAGSLGQDMSDAELTAERFVPDFMMDAGKVVSRSQEMNNPALQVVWSRTGQPTSRQWLFMRPDLRGFSHGGNEAIRLEFERVEPGSLLAGMTFYLAAYDAATNALLGRFAMSLGTKVRLADIGATATGSASQPTSGTAGAASRQNLYTVRLVGKEPMHYTDLTVTRNPAIPVIYFGAILTCLAICIAFYLRRITLSVWCQESSGRIAVAVDYGRERTTLTVGVRKTLEALK